MTVLTDLDRSVLNSFVRCFSFNLAEYDRNFQDKPVLEDVFVDGGMEALDELVDACNRPMALAIANRDTDMIVTALAVLISQIGVATFREYGPETAAKTLVSFLSIPEVERLVDCSEDAVEKVASVIENVCSRREQLEGEGALMITAVLDSILEFKTS